MFEASGEYGSEERWGQMSYQICFLLAWQMSWNLLLVSSYYQGTLRNYQGTVAVWIVCCCNSNKTNISVHLLYASRR